MSKRRSRPKTGIPQPFDLTVKEMVAQRAADIAEYLGVDAESIEVVNVEMPALRRVVDHAWRVSKPVDHLVLVEFQSSYEPDMLERLNVYVALLTERHQLAVRPILILLREEADTPRWTGEWNSGLPGQSPSQTLRYEKRCVAREPFEKFLQGGLGLLPFAPVALGAKEQAAWVAEKVISRIQEEAPPALAEKLLVATYLLMGLRYNEAEVNQYFRGVLWMKDSATYQGLIREGFEKGLRQGVAKGEAKGEAKGLRDAILELGERNWGKPKATVRKAIGAIEDVEQLKRIFRNIPDAEGWANLLD